ncbi:uncharacterized protein L3040_003619 [Drepanopeziza brunnea f. sp. 'multigermtubi']|uniref:Lea domain containing protein n=1 Tax=Marssonina brunnea f. sp. multigermtubi (strain MB_m1) TaxID=1072389 RepID=K1W5Z7_MARBU|nr:lea domain containing protein [Drepanopeziza brunnea f. sp. 'multigermtubi' MB_m1]EKD12375.1 lea domain containing protein [Drepanopeziza brunnea f. sp. 'multigermtubi' MB_m1]KAJ5046375.1 hypothetical protein L3040_003619 [Drepanopeziza brunnea f. sp. 'multigermtubi']
MSFLMRTSVRSAASARSVASRPAFFSTSLAARKSAAETVKDSVKTVDRKVSDVLVGGIEAGENAAGKVKEVSGMSAGEVKGKASEVAGQVSGKAQEVAGMSTGEVKGKASEVAGQVSGKAQEVAGMSTGEVKGKASELAGQAKGKANEVAGEAKGKANEVKGKM